MFFTAGIGNGVYFERIWMASFVLICRGETRLWSPQVSEDGKAHPFKINLEAEPQV